MGNQKIKKGSGEPFTPDSCGECRIGQGDTFPEEGLITDRAGGLDALWHSCLSIWHLTHVAWVSQERMVSGYSYFLHGGWLASGPLFQGPPRSCGASHIPCHAVAFGWRSKYPGRRIRLYLPMEGLKKNLQSHLTCRTDDAEFNNDDFVEYYDDIHKDGFNLYGKC